MIGNHRATQIQFDKDCEPAGVEIAPGCPLVQASTHRPEADYLVRGVGSLQRCKRIRMRSLGDNIQGAGQDD